MLWEVNILKVLKRNINCNKWENIMDNETIKEALSYSLGSDMHEV
mgnify:FL=1|jgi:hypothetical protein